MRKHNVKFARRWSRGVTESGAKDRSNFPQTMAHKFVHDKSAQYEANGLLSRLLTGLYSRLNQKPLTLWQRTMNRLKAWDAAADTAVVPPAPRA